MIEVHDLVKKYGQVAAVKGISFTAKPGQVTGFLGPNGAGKTTTMRMLTGFLPPTSGKAIVAGFDVFEQSMEVRKRVGLSAGKRTALSRYDGAGLSHVYGRDTWD